MEQVVKEDVISILDSVVKVLRKGDVAGLDLLSNRTIHNASTYQDKDSISVAVIIYALSKIVKDVEHHAISGWNEALDSIIVCLENASSDLEKGKEAEYRIQINSILKKIGSIDKKLEWYIEDVLNKSRVIKGAKLYEHGLSLGQAASLLGVSQYELMGYVGKTQIIDSAHEEGVDIKERLGYAKKLFGVK